MASSRRFVPYAVSLVLIGLFAAAAAHAQTATSDYKLLEPIYTSSGEKVTTVSFQSYLLTMYKLLIALAGVLAVVKIVYGGFLYIVSATPFGKENGKEHLNDAVWGLILALSSYLILYTLNPKLVEFDASIEPLPRVIVDQPLGFDLGEIIAKQTRDSRKQYEELTAAAQDLRMRARVAGQAGNQELEMELDTQALTLEKKAAGAYADGIVTASKTRLLDAMATGNSADITQYKKQLSDSYALATNALSEKADYEGLDKLKTRQVGDYAEVNAKEAQRAIDFGDYASAQTLKDSIVRSANARIKELTTAGKTADAENLRNKAVGLVKGIDDYRKKADESYVEVPVPIY